MSSGAMQSKPGNPQVYNDGDQKTSAKGADAPGRFEHGQKNAHDLHDPKDGRSLGERREWEEKLELQEAQEDAERASADPLRPAQEHGNKPSRGAQIDAQLQHEDAEELKRKGSYHGMT